MGFWGTLFSMRKPVGTPSWHRIINGNPLCHSGNSCLAKNSASAGKWTSSRQVSSFCASAHARPFSVASSGCATESASFCTTSTCNIIVCVYNFTCALMTQPTPPYPTRPRPHFTRGVAWSVCLQLQVKLSIVVYPFLCGDSGSLQIRKNAQNASSKLKHGQGWVGLKYTPRLQF